MESKAHSHTRAKAKFYDYKKKSHHCSLFLPCEGQNQQTRQTIAHFRSLQNRAITGKIVEKNPLAKDALKLTRKSAKRSSLERHKKPRKSSNHRQKSGRNPPQRSLQARKEIVKNEREKHSQEAYKHSKSRKKSSQQPTSYQIPKKNRQIGQNEPAIAHKRSPKEQAKSGKNKLSENSEKKPTKMETYHQNHNIKSEMRLLLQPNAAQNRQKSTKVTERTR
jgi:hypothetical protein